MVRRILILSLVGIALALASGFFTRETWMPLLVPAAKDSSADAQDHVSTGEAQQVRLSPQAQANLGLLVKPLALDVYWKAMPLPGIIIDRPAHSDRGVVSPLTAVVTKVHRFPGDTVRPGEVLFTLRLLSESLHLTQSELFKTAQEIQFTQEKLDRIKKFAVIGTEPQQNVFDQENQLRRLKVAMLAYRQELLTRGLTTPQIDGVTEGKYVAEIEVKAPPQPAGHDDLLPGPKENSAFAFEIQELKVDLGQQVQAGQTLCLLSNHQLLFIEGRAFRQETPLLEKAVKEGWPVEVEFLENAESGWPAHEQTFPIRHISNTIDSASRTFAFFMPLVNQSRRIEKDGRTLLLWRFRPGQKVRLQVRVEKFENVFVLPAEAVVREGPEAYVFRQSGDLFVRKPVQVVYQDRQHVVLANDGGVSPGIYVAQTGATQINRVLKSQGGSLPPGSHMHADGSIHSNSAHK